MFHSSELCFYQIECHGRELDEETGQLKPLDGNNNVGLEQKKQKKRAFQVLCQAEGSTRTSTKNAFFTSATLPLILKMVRACDSQVLVE